MLEQPDQLGRAAVRDRRGARVHGGNRRLVGDRIRGRPPLDRRQAGRRLKPFHEIVARVNHLVTIPW